MVAENEIARGPNDARLHDKFGYELDVDLARRKAERILGPHGGASEAETMARARRPDHR